MADRLKRMNVHGTRPQAGAKPAQSPSWLRIAAALLAIGLATLALAGLLLAAQANAREQGAQSVRQAVLNAAAQCCAVEGSYPSSVEYLEQHYGLTINHNDYVVMYEAFAANALPDVRVVAR